MLPHQVDFWAAYLFMTKPVTRFLEFEFFSVKCWNDTPNRYSVLYFNNNNNDNNNNNNI